MIHPTSIASDASVRSPRVLITTDTLGGVWTFALDLAREIAAHGGVSALATMGRPLSASQRASAAAIRGCSVFESDYRLDWMSDPWADVDASENWLLDLEAAWQPEVIHCNTFSHGRLAWHAPVILTVHSCVCTWYRAVRGHPPPSREWAEYVRRAIEALEHADYLVTPTAAFKTALADAYPVDLSRAKVIPNGRLLRPHYTVASKRAHCLAAGRLWDDAKNLRLLATIAPDLPWPCLVAGEEGTPENETPPAMQLLGRLDQTQMAAHMREAAIFLHPALYEPFGLAPLEAGLAGCALVLSDIPTLREVWSEDSALFVNPHDPETWIERVHWLIASSERWQEWGARARQCALAYPRNRMGTTYLDLYKRAAPCDAAHQPSLQSS